MGGMTNISPQDGRALRTAFGQFATGVTIITAQTQNGDPIGITANSFASVSLDPPLLMWSPAKSAGRHDVFTQATHFAVHVMQHDQQNICADFVREGNAFEAYGWHANAHGVPLLDKVLARFECRRYGLTDAGDHTLILGEVQNCAIQNGAPLVFSAGQYGSFTPN